MDPREKMRWLVLLLVDEFNAKQLDVARVFKVSPATISLWLKEMRLRHRIGELEDEVRELRVLASSYISSGAISQSRGYELP